MRRSICYCDPNKVLAGETKTWTFVYTSTTTIPKGAKFKFDLMSKGRDIDWEVPSTNLKKHNNVIYAQINDGKPIAAKELDNPNNLVPDYEFTLPNALEVGSTFKIIVGAPPGTEEKEWDTNGNRAQCTSQRRRSFLLYIDPSGKGRYNDSETFSMDIRGNKVKLIRILAPSFVVRNKRFDVMVRFEDKFGNLTNNTEEEDVLIELSHEHLRENLKWKLFIPETGFMTLPNLYFNEQGVYTIQLVNTSTKEVFKSSPIKCFSENNRHLFWGLLHGESEKIDSTENIESCLRLFRDDKAMNFFGVSPFESQEETSTEVWRSISQNVAEFDEADRFVTFLGFQWQGEAPEEGLRQIIFAKDNKQILRKKDPKNNTLSKIYKSFSPKEMLSIPSFTLSKTAEYNFEDYNPQFERVVEIYNSWGSSECLKSEDNIYPITSTNKGGIQEGHEGSIKAALNKNRRFGFVAGGLDDRGLYAGLYEGGQVQYFPGLTAIIATEHSRASLLEALYNRSCYATTGERIIVGLYLAGSPMGTELSTASKPGLMINRHLSGYVAGTTKLHSLEIIRNGEVLHTFHPTDYFLDFTFDDLSSLSEIAIQNGAKTPPFIYYYLRVTQQDGHMAWSSPIWVDLLPPSKELMKKPQRPSAKTVVIPEIEDEEDLEELDDEE